MQAANPDAVLARFAVEWVHERPEMTLEVAGAVLAVAIRLVDGFVDDRPGLTMRYDRGRVSLDRHATYVVAAFLAGAAR